MPVPYYQFTLSKLYPKDKLHIQFGCKAIIIEDEMTDADIVGVLRFGGFTCIGCTARELTLHEAALMHPKFAKLVSAIHALTGPIPRSVQFP